MLHINPTFNVRFYVRTTKTQGGDSPTPLRGKAWISATKQYLYFTTKVTTTKRKWADFATDGTPTAGADPDLVKVVDTYKAAAQLVLAGAAVNNRIHLLTSDELTCRINAVVTCMKKQKKEKDPQPILVFTTPKNIPLCLNCQHCGERCHAEWETELDEKIASDMALYSGKCDKWKATKEMANADVFDRLIAFYIMVKANKPQLSANDVLGEAVDMLSLMRHDPDRVIKHAQDALERHNKRSEEGKI